jgi:hypothetical protein
MAVKKRIKERKMKKFSWIFALILALSIGFIGCPEPEPPKKGGGDNNGGGGGTDLAFGTGAGQIEVFGSGDSAKGVITYNNGAYTYTYGTGTYSASLLRFKIDLGEDPLSKWQAISFTWQAAGYKENVSVGSNKQLFLLATTDEDAIKNPGKTDAGYLTDAEIKDIVINTTDFVTDPTLRFYEYEGQKTDAPLVNGNAPKTVTMPIARRGFLTGEVWFSIYVHAEADAYTISNFKFLDTYDGPSGGKVDGNMDDAGARPLPTKPSNAVSFDVNIGTWATQAQDTAGTVAKSATTADGVTTVTFDTSGQRISFPLTQPQKDLLDARGNQYVWTDIEAEVVSTEGGTTDFFRYFLGIINTTANWNSTSGSGEGTLEDISIKTQTYTAGRDSDYFVFQYRGASSTTDVATIKITKITISVLPGAPAYFKNAVGMTEGITSFWSTPIGDDGVIDMSANSGAGFGIEDSAITPGGTKDITITYAVWLISGEAKIVLKDGDLSTDADATNKYPTLTTGAVGTLVVNEAWYTTSLAFQKNGDGNSFRIKIISVEVEEE